MPFPTKDMDALESALNTLLAPSGITISFPRIQRILEPNDLIRVTPMQIELRDSPAGKTVLGPVLQLSREQRSQLFDSLVKAYCQSAAVLLVGDVGLSVASGTGFLTVDIGGVEASSADLVVGNPFGSGVIPPPQNLPSAPDGPTVTPAAPPAVGSSPALAGTPSAPATQPVASSGPLEEVCQSIHPNHEGCSRGAGTLAGVVGLFATVGVAGADLFRQRRGPDLVAH